MWHKLAFTILIILHVTAPGIGEIYFEENFDDDRWSTRWTMSQYEEEEVWFGEFESTPGKYFANASNKGIRTTEDDQFYALSTRFPEFSNENKTLVIQYSVKNEKNIRGDRCVGSYIQLFDCTFKPIVLNLETPFLISFGPDMCGYNNVSNRLDITFQHNGENYPIKWRIPQRKDAFTVIYTLILKADGAYQILDDGNIVHQGMVQDDFSFPPAKMNDTLVYAFPRVCGIGFNFWQSDAGTIFDNVLLTDDVTVAEKRRKAVLFGKLLEQLMKATQDSIESANRKRFLEAAIEKERQRMAEEERKEREARRKHETQKDQVKRKENERQESGEKHDGNAKHNQQKQDELTGNLMIPIYIGTSMTVLAVLVGITSAYIGCRSRAKYLLSKEEVDNFIKGMKLAPDNVYDINGIPVVSGQAANLPYNKNKYEVDPCSFKIDSTRPLGFGEYGTVCCGSILRGKVQLEVAVKMLNEGRTNSHALQGLISEIKILAYVGEHENIVKMEGAYTEKLRFGKLFVFLEFCEMGSLEKYLRTYNLGQNKGTKEDCLLDFELQAEATAEGDKRISIMPTEMYKDLQKWSVEIAAAMEFLATKQIVHADLATRNVLLDAKKCAKIADFGLSRRLYNYSQYIKSHAEPLPWRWMAPESLRKNIFNEKTDVWAFGVTLWEMFTIGDQPYPGLSWDVNFSTILERGLRLPEPKHNQGNVYDVMRKCWKIPADDRPTFSELKTMLNCQ